MSIARHHAEWLSLVEVSGPFLSMPVLLKVFPQGLDAHDPDRLRSLRLAYEEWEAHQTDPAFHRAWVRFVLTQTLELPEAVLVEGQKISQTLNVVVGEQGEVLRPDLAVMDDDKPRLLIHTLLPGQHLEKPLSDHRWKASAATRMMELLHGTGCRLGLVTNGEQWMLVDAPRGETTGFASWFTNYWLEEPITLRAFRTLLGARRFFGVPDGETLAAMLAESAANQQEVTDQLGYQVRKAVEVLIQSLDRADQDHGRQLLAQVPEEELYRAALTVMMRLVFLFSAEERGLLLLGDPLYDQHYAVSTLRTQLREAADQHGEEVLERRLDAWCRLLTTFRAVYSGAWHERLKLPAYGGKLFDPDQFPFLEGRPVRDTPLPVNNRTVLHLLEALQILQVKVPGGGPAEARRLSFRALDIEQIGHVYEGLLDHTARRAKEPCLGLLGTKDKEPEVSLAELEGLRTKGEVDLLKYLKEQTGKSEPALRKALAVTVEGLEIGRFKAACGNDEKLWGRVRPFAGLVRRDTFEYPVVIPSGSIFVTEGTDRRSSGTHYTPKSLTEPIVKYTLEPLVYIGPAEGKPNNEWKLRPAKELLDLKICDMATGSGAFLVQACRYLADRLMEAWDDEEATHPGLPGTVPEGKASEGQPHESLTGQEADERTIKAQRLVAQRCLYGVDKNPLAVEMAKLSLWLLTMARDLPFTFLDHSIRCGDSLVGIHDLEQLRRLHFDLNAQSQYLLSCDMRAMVNETVDLRLRIEEMQADDIEDVEAQERLLHEAEEKMARLRYAADILTATELKPTKASEREGLRDDAAIRIGYYVTDGTLDEFRQAARKDLAGQNPFHWPLEFPEVFARRGGFDAFVGNPPFMGGKKITGSLQEPYREFLVVWLANNQRGNSDLCAYFFLRASQLLRQGGAFGLIATNTIAQGETREVGLDQLAQDGCVIHRAVPSRKWPGLATVEVAHVWVRRGDWSGPYVLDDKPTQGISAFLTPSGSVTGNPYRLKQSMGIAFQGSNLRGIGFVLDPQTAEALIERDSCNKDVLFPYLNGEDLNSRPDQSASRWVINFFDWGRERAESYSEPFAIVTEKVLPERKKIKHEGTRKRGTEYFWRYDSIGKELYTKIAGMKRVLVKSEVGNRLSFALVPNASVFSHMLIVFATDDEATLSVLQSTIHEVWARQYGSSMRTDLRYTPVACVETFVFAPSSGPLKRVGQQYSDYRRQLMLTRQEGLTKTYTRFHDKSETADDIAKLRQLHVEMDQTVAAAYGWTNLDLGHGFHQTKQGLRYTISEAARQEVLGRLLQLNHERYAEEVKQGLHDKSGKGGNKRQSRKKSSEPTLFVTDDDDSTDGRSE